MKYSNIKNLALLALACAGLFYATNCKNNEYRPESNPPAADLDQPTDDDIDITVTDTDEDIDITTTTIGDIEPPPPSPTTIDTGVGEPLGDDAPPLVWSVTAVQVDVSLAELCGLTAQETYFEFDSATLSERGEERLNKLAKCMQEKIPADRNLMLVGHADPRGSDEYNKKLGRSRADSVADYLVAQGIDKNRLQVKSMGEAGDRDIPYAEQRRVDITLATGT